MLVGQQIGPFEIESELGSGAMGTVYKAKFHRSAEKVVPVALKVVALGLLGNEGAMARFDREANILKQLKHPNIVRLIAHGKINKSNPYIAMEFIDGEPLDRVLARRGKLGWEEVAAYGKQLAEALQYAHDKGIIHRDLKPSNLMITKDGALKLTDFGIAKDTDVTALTGANSTIGTAAYMSPEQCKGDRNLSNKSDLYSLGIVFFELLTGRKPFTAETTVEMFLKHVNEKAPRIGKFANELPPKFESLILQLLEKDKDNRPVDAAWVARMIGEIEEDAFARKSAGLSVAQARTAKPVNQAGDKMDAADKEAARALRGKRKKSKKKEMVPLLERKWVHAVGLASVLAVLIAGAFFALRPASADRLYADYKRADTPAAKAEAAAKYLGAYGAKGGERADEVAAGFREATVQDRERQLSNRNAAPALRKPAEGDDPEAFEQAMQAI
ncbi:MAG TPA: serine/threonine-protein kinase, partial [Gemmata sp.]